MSVPLTDDLRQQYQNFFDSCVINPLRLSDVNRIVSRIVPNRQRYQAVGDALNIPWYLIAVIHSLESDLDFTTHLHNGDPLSARTVHVPAGQPRDGNPPFTWEASATDALRAKHLANLADLTLPSILFRIEGYNGFGYRGLTPPVPTPYLWSFCNHYIKGKFVADHQFDPNRPSQQCGAAVLLFKMAQNGTITFPSAAASAPGPVAPPPSPSGSAATPTPPPAAAITAADLAAQFDSAVQFSSERSDAAEWLQQALNTFPGINLKADGVAGKKTSAAYQQVTGHFLVGDPRA